MSTSESQNSDSPLDNFRSALGFLTILGGSATPTAQTMAWFPLVGALIGTILGAIWWAAAEIWPPIVAAPVVLVANLIITGALHHDGLADSADGLLPHLETKQRLSIMRQPDIGSFGVLALVGTLVLQVSSLAVSPVNLALLAAITSTSRTMMVAVAASFPYVRKSGLVHDFLGNKSHFTVLYGLVLAATLGVLSTGARGLISVLSVVVAAWAVALLAKARLGGFSGDVLGACGVIGETAGLLVMGVKL